MSKLFAERFKSARIMNGLSLQDLADRIENKVSRQALHKYEKGDAMPDSELLGILCNVLHIRPDYFTRDIKVELESIHFRKHEKLPTKEQSGIIERSREILSRYLELEDFVGLNGPFVNPIQKATVSSLEDIESIVDFLRKEWGLYETPIPNVIELLEDKHIKILEMEEGDEFDGLQAIIKDGSNPLFVLNASKLKSKDRKRFTSLHELGHLLLPLNGILEKDAERYCHAFAGAMLLPRNAAFKVLGTKRNKLSIHELGIIKQQYGISIQAIIYRANNLRIISDSYMKYLFRYINEMGWKIEEPFELVGDENPVRFDQILYRALSEEVISISKAAALKNMSLSEFRTKMMTAG